MLTTERNNSLITQTHSEYTPWRTDLAGLVQMQIFNLTSITAILLFPGLSTLQESPDEVIL